MTQPAGDFDQVLAHVERSNEEQERWVARLPAETRADTRTRWRMISFSKGALRFTRVVTM